MKAQGDGATATTTAAAAPNHGEGGGEKKSVNPELWQACAGPLLNLPSPGTHVVYFPQGHSEQVAASLNKDVDAQIPNYTNLPSKIPCLLHNVTLHADSDTDEIYAQMTLQPVPSFDTDALLRSDISIKSSKPQPEFFCKHLTASDTSTHGGFSVPRSAAEKIFPTLDYSVAGQHPAQELVARDLHGNVWRFRHIYRGHPKRHLLTTGWSLFVSGKKLLAGDCVVFVRDEMQQLLLGIRRANRQPSNLPSSVLSSDSMHIGVLAAAAHAVANNSPFTVFYNPRASPSEFVIPLAKYYKAVYSHHISAGMRFRMMFETEDSGIRRCMGTIIGVSDLDAVRWKNSPWRNLQVGWNESTLGERRSKVSIWEIEPVTVTAPFFICPPPFIRSKRPRLPGMPDDEPSDFNDLLKSAMPWLGDDTCIRDFQAFPSLSLVEWMNIQQNPALASYVPSMSGLVLQNLASADIANQLGFSTSQTSQSNNVSFGAQKTLQTTQQLDHIQKLPSTSSALGTVTLLSQQLGDITEQPRNLTNMTLPQGQVHTQLLNPLNLVQTNNILQQQQSSIQNHQLLKNLSQNPPQQHQQTTMGQNQQQNSIQSPMPDHLNHQLQLSDNQVQLQSLQKLQQQQQTLLAQQSTLQQPSQLIQIQDQQRQLLEVVQNSNSRALTPGQALEILPMLQNSLPEANFTTHQITTPSSQKIQFSHLSQQPRLLSERPGHIGLPPTSTTNLHPVSGCSILTGAGQSVITDDVPSCSTSPSTNNCAKALPPVISSQIHRGPTIGDDMAQSAVTILSPSALETMPSNTNMGKDVQPKYEVKPSLNISKTQNQGNFAPQAYLNGGAVQTDYLDSSSSTTSVCFFQTDSHTHHNNPLSYNPQSMYCRDNSQNVDVQVDARSNVPYINDINGQMGMPQDLDSILTKGTVGLGKDLSNNFSSRGLLGDYENNRDALPEFSSSMVSQTFGVPHMSFNSIDSTLNGSSYLNRGPWAPPPPPPPPPAPQHLYQRKRTYTKVSKRGAVGRSIDITRYSGYEELKQDLALMFGIEGQLEDQQRVGWKLVYVDHENDVLLVGDDPWEEFVNCVRRFKILSPQEVQQMSLDGDFGNGGLPYPADSSSDGGNT
ncbi:hypothetical protein RJT34_02736 [Clitoria ternatea]|uniref:Auxin response factor n=1 Tax=Clitoria ternatea TaxID=43366 RepID=A0AAN9KLL1_CLITE